MFGSTTIEIAIGVIVVFILVSTICTAIREGIESVLKTRAAYLEQGIRQLLNDTQGTGLAKSLYNHPLVFGLFNGDYSAGKHKDTTAVFANGKNLPSYIPSKNFARALMDIAAAGVSPDASNTGNTAPIVSLDNIRQNISNIGNPPIQRMMLNAIDMAQGDLNKAQANIENWFNSGMDRVSGWYKRSTQSIIFVIALFVAVGMNVNTITIINYLAKSDTARKIMIKQAEVLNKNQELQYTEAQAKLNELNLPIGWDKNTFCDIIYPGNSTEANAGSILFAVFGWLITAFAATLGAPYWFDLLNRVMVIRSTVKPHEKSLEEGSQDNRNRTPDVVYMAPQPAVAAAGPDPTHEHATADSADIDGCDVPFDSLTADDELPESKGGTAL